MKRNHISDTLPVVTAVSYKDDRRGERSEFEAFEFPVGKISFLSEECQEVLDRKAVKGFCMKRFKGDLRTRSLDYKTLSPGQQLGIGGAVIEITGVGKHCHAEECPAFNKERTCIMLSETMFGQVIRSGVVAVNDEIEVL